MAQAVRASAPVVESLEVRRLMIAQDYGDAPDSYGTLDASGGPHHSASGNSMVLGTFRSFDSNGKPSANADLDDGDDGVFIGSTLLQDQTIAGSTVTLSIRVKTDPAPNNTAYLHAWIDFDGNGKFDSNEKIADNLALSTGDHPLVVSIPDSAKPGVTYARFRLNGQSAPAQGPTGGSLSGLGEVEDYKLTLASPETVASVSSISANGTYGTGSVIAVTATFTGSVTVSGGTPQIALNSGGTATFASGSGSSTLTFNYTVAAGQNAADLDYSSTGALTLNGATIAGDNGLPATLTLPTPGSAGSLGFNKNIVIDTSAPTVTINQAAAQDDPTAASPIAFDVKFSEQVNGFDFNDVSFAGSTAGGTLLANVTGSGDTYTVNVSGMTTSGLVILSIPAGAAKDLAGSDSLASTSTDNTVKYAPNPSLVVTTIEDEDNGTSDPAFGTGTSLREAIAFAKVHAGADTITFDPTIFLDGQLTGISISGAPFTLNDTVDATTIQGLGEERISINGSSRSGPAFVIAANTITTIAELNIQGASGTAGGAIVNSGTLSVEAVSIVGNSATTSGSALQNYGKAVIRNAAIFDNTTFGSGGGAIDNAGGTLIVVNSTFSGNQTAGAGGAIHASGTSDVTLVNTTIVDGKAATGGGISITGGSLTLRNTIVARNFASDGTTPSDIERTDPATITGSNNLIGAGGSGGLVDGVSGNHVGVAAASLGLDMLNGNGGSTATIALLINSPALNAGSNALATDPGLDGTYGTIDDTPLATDQRGAGFPRILGSAVDIGAFEATPPTISIGDVSKLEGNSGTTLFQFPVTRTNGAGVAAVDFGTVRDSANDIDDYNYATGSVFFADGEIAKTITIGVKGDTNFEPDQKFKVVLSNPLNAQFAKSVGLGTILNDDGKVGLSINDVVINEGNSGTKNLVFTVTLDAGSHPITTVKYTTVGGSATSGTDFAAKTGTLTFGTFVTSQTITIPIKGDTTIEPDETFTVKLSNVAGGAVIVDDTGVGTIVNDDFPPLPRLTINDVIVTEGTGTGVTLLSFTVKLDKAATGNVSVNFTTANGTATAGSDYTASSGTVTFAAGQLIKTVTIQVKKDAVKEADETLFLNLSNLTGLATLADAQGKGTIRNDD